MKNLKKDFDLKEELIKKHYHGQEKYGAFSFLNDGRDMNLEAADELIDAINYLIYLAITDAVGAEELKKMSEEEFNITYEKIVAKLYDMPDKAAPVVKALIKLIDKLKK